MEISDKEKTDDAGIYFLDGNNAGMNPKALALNVSNYKTTTDLPNTTTYGATNPDPDNFRIQVTDTTTNAATVTATLTVTRGKDNTLVSSHLYTLSARGGAVNSYRGEYLRLVSDSTDDAVAGFQTIQVKLRDKVTLSYTNPANVTITKQMTVGRFLYSGSNNEPDQRRHSVETLGVHIVVYRNAANTGPTATRAEIEAEITRLEERLAQSTLNVDATIDMGGAGDPGVPLGGALSTGLYKGHKYLVLELDDYDKEIL